MKYFCIALLLAFAALTFRFVTSQTFFAGFEAYPRSADGAGHGLPAKTLNPHEVEKLIRAAAAKHRVPEAFVKSIVRAESNFNCAAVSSRGAIGLMQLMPDTAQEFGAEDPSIPEQNIEAGTRYLRFLMDRYSKRPHSVKHVIAAYNAGPGNVDRYRGVPPFRETRNYVKRVMGYMREFEGPQMLVARSSRPAPRVGVAEVTAE
jgi:soluble lytic murein transglycosylase-like protein